MDAYERKEPYLSYEDQFTQQLERTAAAVEITLRNPKFMFAHMKQQVQMADMFETNGLAGIHFTMFLTFLKTNGSDEQKKKMAFSCPGGKVLWCICSNRVGPRLQREGVSKQQQRFARILMSLRFTPPL